MTELSDRLYFLADDATTGVELLPPRLARRARQRRRRRLRIGAVAVTAAAVVLLALTTLVPLRHHTTRVATRSSPTTAPVPGTVPPPLSQLSSLALTQAAQAGDVTPDSGMVVATTLEAARGLLDDSNTRTDATPIYLVVLSGRFQCGRSCFGLLSPPPTGSTMTLIVGRQDLRVQGFGLSDRAIDLTPLGAVYRLDLTATVVVPDVLYMPVAAATTALAGLGLKVSVHQEQSSLMPLGVIISQHPPGSTLLPPGATVTLSVA